MEETKIVDILGGFSPLFFIMTETLDFKRKAVILSQVIIGISCVCTCASNSLRIIQNC